uniref:Uncharacterized protein n=1 Tax=Streptococcus dysgalactiae subsp. equisimilis TaxID=119602 RepID=A0A0B5E6E8_STREQ|nr:hypothetical protein [Streptococcus dysgalactiae subsp. equisimilis]
MIAIPYFCRNTFQQKYGIIRTLVSKKSNAMTSKKDQHFKIMLIFFITVLGES